MHNKLFGRVEEEAVRKQTVAELKSMTEMIEAGSAILPHLEMLVVHRTCSDPGANIVNKLLLPIVQERIQKLAKEHAAAKILEAQEDLIKAEALTSF